MPGVTEPTTSGPPTSRRTLAKAAVAATVGVGAVGAAVRLGQDDDTEERGGALVLSAEGGSDIAELEVPLPAGGVNCELHQRTAVRLDVHYRAEPVGGDGYVPEQLPVGAELGEGMVLP